MSIKQTAEYLNMSAASLGILARNGRIPAAKVGRAWRFRKDDIDAFLRQQYQVKAEEQKAA